MRTKPLDQTQLAFRNAIRQEEESDTDMLKLPFRAMAAIALLGLAPTQGHATGPGEMARNLAPGLSGSFIKEHAPTLAPFAHVRFCMKHPQECQVPQEGGAETPTIDMEAALSGVNREINKRIKQINDDDKADFGDSWTVASRSGDCEDIALAKRKELISIGWSPRALRIAVTRTAKGEGHAVLVVRTSKGDLVLDNRSDTVKGWTRTDLTWLKIQSSDNPRLWMSL